MSCLLLSTGHLAGPALPFLGSLHRTIPNWVGGTEAGQHGGSGAIDSGDSIFVVIEGLFELFVIPDLFLYFLWVELTSLIDDLHGQIVILFSDPFLPPNITT